MILIVLLLIPITAIYIIWNKHCLNILFVSLLVGFIGLILKTPVKYIASDLGCTYLCFILAILWIRPLDILRCNLLKRDDKFCLKRFLIPFFILILLALLTYLEILSPLKTTMMTIIVTISPWNVADIITTIVESGTNSVGSQKATLGGAVGPNSRLEPKIKKPWDFSKLLSNNSDKSWKPGSLIFDVITGGRVPRDVPAGPFHPNPLGTDAPANPNPLGTNVPANPNPLGTNVPANPAGNNSIPSGNRTRAPYRWLKKSEFSAHTKQQGIQPVGNFGNVHYVPRGVEGKLTIARIYVQASEQFERGFNPDGGNQPAAANLAEVLTSIRSIRTLQLTDNILNSYPGLRDFMNSALLYKYPDSPEVNNKKNVDYKLLDALRSAP